MDKKDIISLTIFQQSPISTQIFSADGTLQAVNKAWEKLWNVKHDQLAGYNVLKDGRLVEKGIMSFIKKAFKGQTINIPAIKYEPYKTKNIKNAIPYRYVRAFMYPVKDAKNKVINVVLQHEDITEQIEYERRLQEVNRLNTTVLESITDIFFSLDKKLLFKYINKKAEDLIQKKATELIGKNVWEVYPEHKNSLFGKKLTYSVKSKRTVEFDYCVPQSSIWFKFRFYPSDEGISIFVTDITQFKMAERDIARSEERLRLAVEAGKIGVWDWDIRTNHILWSDRIYEIHGVKKSDRSLKFDDFINVVYPDDLKLVRTTLDKAISEKSSYELEFRAFGQMRKIIWLFTRAKVFFDSNGKPVRMLGATIDITARKKLEKQKDEFIGLASHELKTPVTSLKAYGQVLQKLFEKKGDKQSVLLLQKMDIQINKLTNLIADLLDVTKIQEGKLEFRKTRFALNQLISEVVEEIQRTTDKHRIVAHLIPKVKIMGDQERYAQVLINLLTNAIKYSPGNKKITLSSKRVNDEIWITVKDRGLGIPVDKQSQVFKRFFRVENKAAETYPGLGLGLYISKEIIERQNGKIWVESSAGKGAKFTFTIPIRRYNKKL